MQNLKQLNSVKQNKMVVTRSCGVGEMGVVGQRHKLAIMGWIPSGDLMYSVVITVNIIILYF